ncbi:carbohydrate ABC transporter permease [Oceanotoga sp. DSM 15011]|jgi:multiple sugar transport system permease protein|uniref:Carbohydrate ABC transporter membrane protein 2 (CUT1 family) n=1 Tax=Oceanotoga teriensis TaxID=515440 RepID=A0AA45C742_9BACT|nr:MULTISPECIES: carbohydrate ABC transporter permease [Oceanotoga]MDN5341393.1 multiple sugar transport system permease protein [Oceanotoga sp.]MDO7975876.1 carbohydrate ABC transporter permease [Oceanotoga teriensis]PWJ95147.1 carbohydrate ABC transporter membrane protein 2 (CUT1 family) [Oceanotoga teriensis]UYO99139.1 carbohydrate ABC transporter permease [Oceanotoga sp. DSM 15011]
MKAKTKEKTRINIMRIITILVCIIYALPLIWMVTTSLKTDAEIMAFPPQWLPDKPIWDNYVQATNYFPFWKYFGNSIIITFGCVIGSLISCPMIAYSFSKINWWGKNIFFYMMLGTMMLPMVVTMIPTFVIFSKLGWINTYLPLIIPAFTGTPAFIFLLRQFFKTVPNALLEAARIDGASEFTIFRKIMLPLSKPILFLIALQQFVGSWNNYFMPLIYLNDENLFPLALGLPLFQGKYETHWNWSMAASTISLIPTLIFFLIAQKYLIEGIKIQGMKG